jgi:hypothetical protein
MARPREGTGHSSFSGPGGHLPETSSGGSKKYLEKVDETFGTLISSISVPDESNAEDPLGSDHQVAQLSLVMAD